MQALRLTHVNADSRGRIIVALVHAGSAGGFREGDTMRDILVYADDFQEWNHGVEYAARLAAAERAALTALFVYPTPAYMMPACTTPALLAAMVERTQRIEQEALAAEGRFLEWTRGIGVAKSSWHVAEGFPPEALARLGNWHDLLVFERNDEMPWESAGDLGALILRIGLPCIVVPPGSTHDPGEIECVVLGWNGTPEALRSAYAARPWLRRAKRVVVLSGRQRDPSGEVDWHPPLDVLTYLKRHDIEHEVQQLSADDADAGPALLAAAAAFRADLLVMGAYGRNRFSEWVFGGATRHVLRNARIPVLFLH